MHEKTRLIARAGWDAKHNTLAIIFCYPQLIDLSSNLCHFAQSGVHNAIINAQNVQHFAQIANQMR